MSAARAAFDWRRSRPAATAALVLGQKIQYSGTEVSSALVAKTDDAKRLAGTLKFDRTGAGGPKVDVEFDAALVKEVTAP